MSFNLIEKYIEKDIIRHVKLVEFFFEFGSLSLNNLAETLGVSLKTVKLDMEIIREKLCDEISYYNKKGNTVKLYFSKQLSRFELVVKLYEDSKFLRVCSRYIVGETNYLKIVEKEFISVSKAFKLKNKVELYFKEYKAINDLNELDELRYRYLILTIWMRCSLLDKYVNKTKYNLATNIAHQIIYKFSNHLNEHGYNLLCKSIYLSLMRNNNQLKFIDKKLEIIKEKFVCKEISEIINKSTNDLDESELVYLSLIYRLLPLNSTNYLTLEIDYDYLRTNIIEKNVEILELIFLFEQEFNVSLTKNILFERPLILFLLSIWLDTQTLLVNRHCLLNEEQKLVCVRVRHVVNKWLKQNCYNNIDILETTLEQFCLEVFSVLTSMVKNKYKTTIMIIAEFESAHILYRENIKGWLNDTNFILDNTLYYSLKDIPCFMTSTPKIIICDRSLIFDNDLIKEKHVYPISLSTLENDIRNILIDYFV